MKSKSLLINYSGYPISPNAFMPDNGLAVLAGSLLKHGHMTTILDYNTLDSMQLRPHKYGKRLFELTQDNKDHSEEKNKIYDRIDKIAVKDISEKAKEILAIVKEKDIDFLGFKLWTGKSFKNSMELAAEIKKRNPSILIFAGGPHVDYFRSRIYKVTKSFDVLAYGEGEETIIALADYSLGNRKLISIPNLIIRTGNGGVETYEKRLDDLNNSSPIYDPAIYPALKGDAKLKMFIAEFSRGCPNKCNFCGHSNKSGALRRSKSAKNIIKEFQYIAKTHSSRIFRNGDSNTPGSLIKEVAEMIIKSGTNVEYALISHVASLTPECLTSLTKSGCFSLFIGIESGNQDIINKVINKGLKLERAKKIIAQAREKGLFVVTSYIYPTPGETKKTKNDTIDFIMKSKTNVASICPPIVTPRSAWGENPQRFGIELSDNYFDDLMFFTPDLFYPPTMWDPLNYRINNKNFIEIAQESDDFARFIEREGKKHGGILTQVMEDAALMAKHCNMDYCDFRDSVRHYLSVGDHKSMCSLVKKFNKSARNPTNQYLSSSTGLQDRNDSQNHYDEGGRLKLA